MSSIDPLINNSRKIFRPVDIATLLYIFIEILLILFFRLGQPGYVYMIIFYLAAAGIVFFVAVYPIETPNGLWRLIRVGYPIFLFMFFYKALGIQIFMIFNAPFDYLVHNIELMIFGNDPAFLLQPYMTIWLNEFMNFFYFSYYFTIPVVVAMLVFYKKWDSVEETILATSVTFYICYILFILFPVMGPRFYLSEVYYLPMIGPLITSLAVNTVEFGGHMGAAMPSSHCAVALVAAWAISKNFPKLTAIAYIHLILLCVSTVYGRYHYILDVVVGILIGILGIWLSNRWFTRFISQNGGNNILKNLVVADKKIDVAVKE